MILTLAELNRRVDEINKVGGYLDLSGLTSKYKKLKNGDYVPKRYLYADNIFTHIKGKKK